MKMNEDKEIGGGSSNIGAGSGDVPSEGWEDVTDKPGI